MLAASALPVVRAEQPPAPPKPPADASAAQSEAMPAPQNAKSSKDTTLTLSDAEAMAISCHPALRAAGARVQAAHGNWVQVGLKPNPQIGYQGTEIGDEGRAGQQGAFFSQELVTAGKLDLNRAVAAREQAVAEQRGGTHPLASFDLHAKGLFRSTCRRTGRGARTPVERYRGAIDEHFRTPAEGDGRAQNVAAAKPNRKRVGRPSRTTSGRTCDGRPQSFSDGSRQSRSKSCHSSKTYFARPLPELDLATSNVG